MSLGTSLRIYRLSFVFHIRLLYTSLHTTCPATPKQLCHSLDIDNIIAKDYGSGWLQGQMLLTDYFFQGICVVEKQVQEKFGLEIE